MARLEWPEDILSLPEGSEIGSRIEMRDGREVMVPFRKQATGHAYIPEDKPFVAFDEKGHAWSPKHIEGEWVRVRQPNFEWILS